MVTEIEQIRRYISEGFFRDTVASCVVILNSRFLGVLSKRLPWYVNEAPLENVSKDDQIHCAKYSSSG
jgi:hypothetical protein